MACCVPVRHAYFTNRGFYSAPLVSLAISWSQHRASGSTCPFLPTLLVAPQPRHCASLLTPWSRHRASRSTRPFLPTLLASSQAAIARIRHDDYGPAQALARAVVDFSYEPHRRSSNITIRWTPSHEGVEGNEQADIPAKRAAEGRGSRAPPEGQAPQGAGKGSEGAGREVLPAPFRPRGDRPPPPPKNRPGAGRQVLVVRQRRGSDAPPSVHQVLALDARDPPALAESREGL